MLRLMVIALLLVMIASVATAEIVNVELPYIASCLEQDRLTIEDFGPYAAVITYYNSGERCSSLVTVRAVSPNGIEADVQIQLGSQGEDGETVYVRPRDPSVDVDHPWQYMPDGESRQFVLSKLTS